jgi:hypothetical protein
MVFGIGEGSIEIKMPKTNFAHGETATGEIVLTLKQPKKARELRLLFYGEVKNTQRDRDGKRKTHTQRILEQKITLAGEGEFPTGSKSYSFEVKLPKFGQNRVQGEGMGVAAANFLMDIADPSKHARWYLNASLDVPGSLDISKKIRITIYQ